MEPAQKQVALVYRTVVRTVNDDPANNQWVLNLEMMPALMFVNGSPTLAPGDRVKITITKEPNPDAQPC